MRTRPLSSTNKYLKDPAQRKFLADRSVITSSGVEGVAVDLSEILNIEIPRRPKRIYKNIKQ